MLRFTTSLWDHVVFIALRFAHDAREIGARAGHIPKRICRFRRRRNAFYIHGSNQHARPIIVQKLLRRAAHRLLDCRFLRRQNCIYIRCSDASRQLRFNCNARHPRDIFGLK